MAYIECKKGHLYNSDQYDSCPYCSGGGKRIEFGKEPDDRSDIESTVKLRPENKPKNVEHEKTIADIDIAEAAPSLSADSEKTVGILQKNMNIEPVAGWLVCIEGPDFGKDYKVYARNNTIGRSDKMDVFLKGDTAISRDSHARIGYDEKHNVFHIIPSETINNIYVNDDPVYVPKKLNSHDVIEIGSTKLLFVPLCNEKFSWNKGIKIGE